MNALKRYSNKACVFFIVGVLLMTAPFAAMAAVQCDVPSATSEKIAKTFTCTQQPGITYRFTQCVAEILKNVTATAFNSILSSMAKVVGATLTIYVALTGMKMVLGGVRNIKAEGLTTLLKLGFVAAFALNTGPSGGTTGLQSVYDLVQGINSGMVNLVSTTIVSDGTCTDASGNVQKDIWQRVDCAIFAFIGRVTPTYEPKKGPDGAVLTDAKGNPLMQAKLPLGPRDPNCNGNLVNGPVDGITLFQIGMAQLFTPHGIFLLFLLMAAALMMLIAFARALQVYVISFVAIAFLMMLAPLFIPLFLFTRTRQMFLTWVTMILGYVIQPAMLMGFLAFMLAAMNVALFGSADNPGGLKASLDKLNAAMVREQCTTMELAWEGHPITGDGTERTISDLQAVQRVMKQEVNNIHAPVVPIPYTDLAVFMVQLIACVVLLYVLMALMANVADFVAGLSAGAGSNLLRYGGGMQQLSGAARDAFNNFNK